MCFIILETLSNVYDTFCFKDRQLLDCVKKTQQDPELKANHVKVADNSDQTRKHIENESVGEVATTPENPVPSIETFQPTTATAYVYTIPTTAPITQTPVTVLYSTPYFVRADAGQPPPPQPSPPNGYVNAV